jgi:hypothetical protein
MGLGIAVWVLFILLVVGAAVGSWAAEPWRARGSAGAWSVLLLIVGAVLWRLWPWSG